MSKKILIIVESIDVEDSSGSKANVTLIKNLKKAGFNLKVFHYTRKNIQLDGIDCVSLKENRKSLLFFLSRTERYIRYTFKIELNRKLENLFGFSFTLLNDRNSIAKELKKSIDFDPDLVLTLSKGGSFRPHHALLKLPDLQGRWMAYIHDPYPMHWYPPPYPWYEPGFQQKEDFMKQVADKARFIAYPSRLLLEWMGSKYYTFEEKGIVIPHQLEDNNSTKNAQDESISSIDFDTTKFNIVHAGNLIRGREPFGLIEGFNRFLLSNPDVRNNIRLVLVGGRNYYSEYLLSKQQENPEIIISETKLTFDETKLIQEKASVNIILEAKSEISPFLPGKFPHCIEADNMILLLSPPESESRRLLGKDYPYWAEIDNAPLISDLLEKLYIVWMNDPEDLQLDRHDLKEYLSFSYLKETLDSLRF